MTVPGRARRLRPRLTAASGEGAGRRLQALVEALTTQPPPADADGLLDALDESFRDVRADRVWLALAVLGRGLPTAGETRDALLRAEVDGAWSVLGPLLEAVTSRWRTRPSEVRVVSSSVLVDLQHTARTELATGIQRVARETSRRWWEGHDVVLVGWDRRERSLRELTATEQARALGKARGHQKPNGDHPSPTIVPFRSTYLLPELAVEPERTTRIQALAQYSGCTTAVIGFDCVPITNAETTAVGMGGAFAGNLAAVRHMDRVAAISGGAAAEYRGWRRMLRGAGDPGPDIRAVSLAVEATAVEDADLKDAQSRFLVPGRPLVLCVGSHEPRKNHLAVLHAAERLWREGLQFSLSFVGGNTWNSSEFTDRLRALQAGGRTVQAVTSVSDPTLWGAYRLARVVLFPSLNEGFGLPAAEALACGTPVITSSFGSMAEIAAEGGALLVDPRNDDDLTCALRDVLVDDLLHARLAHEASTRVTRSWDTYAHEAWEFLVEGTSRAVVRESG